VPVAFPGGAEASVREREPTVNAFEGQDIESKIQKVCVNIVRSFVGLYTQLGEALALARVRHVGQCTADTQEMSCNKDLMWPFDATSKQWNFTVSLESTATQHRRYTEKLCITIYGRKNCPATQLNSFFSDTVQYVLGFSYQDTR
jgi:hypothetical protein